MSWSITATRSSGVISSADVTLPRKLSLCRTKSFNAISLQTKTERFLLDKFLLKWHIQNFGSEKSIPSLMVILQVTHEGAFPGFLTFLINFQSCSVQSLPPTPASTSATSLTAEITNLVKRAVQDSSREKPSEISKQVTDITLAVTQKPAEKAPTPLQSF